MPGIRLSKSAVCQDTLKQFYVQGGNSGVRCSKERKNLFLLGVKVNIHQLALDMGGQDCLMKQAKRSSITLGEILQITKRKTWKNQSSQEKGVSLHKMTAKYKTFKVKKGEGQRVSG